MSPVPVFFCYCWRSGKTAFARARTDQTSTHHIRQLMVSLSDFPLHAFLFHVFLKKVIPASAGTTFLKIGPHHFTSNNTTFWTPNWSLKSQFSYLCSSLPLLCSFGLVFFALGANLGQTWVQLGPFWANLGPTSATLGQFRRTWDPLGVNLCHLAPK